MDAVTGHVSKAISSCNFLLVLGTLQNVWSLSQGAKAIISSLLKSDRRSLRTQLPLPCCVTLASHAHARGGGEPQVLPRGVATEIGSENRAGSTLEPQGSSSFSALQLSRTPVRAAARQQDRRTPGLVRERGGAGLRRAGGVSRRLQRCPFPGPSLCNQPGCPPARAGAQVPCERRAASSSARPRGACL